jgi:hypothetical protein
MRLKAALVFCLLAGLALTVSGLAQEGHPLTGTWYGDYGVGTDTAKRSHLTIEMNWDGKEVKGLVNPGPDSYQLKVITLDSSKWTVHMEADGKDEKGQPAHFVADGKLENIGSYNRTITGTWNYGATKANFKLRRD